MVDEDGRLGPERAKPGGMQILVGAVVAAADDVGDAEVEVVDDRCPVIGGAAVAADDHEGPHARRREEEGAVADRGVLGEVGGLDVAFRP